MLVLDLGVFHRRAHTVKFREALAWSVVWIALAVIFAVVVFFWHGRTPALEFVTGYVIELSLSVDNLFVFLLIFRFFQVPRRPSAQSPVLGNPRSAHHARRLHRRGRGAHPEIPLDRLRLRRLPGVQRHQAVLPGGGRDPSREKSGAASVPPLCTGDRDYEGDKFFVRRPGLYATPLFVVLLVVETTDLLFAVDSIPAILAITRDAFIVYTSNVFAIMGLRSMYFALAGMMEMFRYLKDGLSVVLVFVGIKMLLSLYFEIPTLSRPGSGGQRDLAISVIASMVNPKKAT